MSLLIASTGKNCRSFTILALTNHLLLLYLTKSLQQLVLTLHQLLEKGDLLGRSSNLWEILTHVDKDFVSVVIGGFEAGLRKTCEEKLVNK